MSTTTSNQEDTAESQEGKVIAGCFIDIITEKEDAMIKQDPALGSNNCIVLAQCSRVTHTSPDTKSPGSQSVRYHTPRQSNCAPAIASSDITTVTPVTARQACLGDSLDLVKGNCEGISNIIVDKEMCLKQFIYSIVLC
jgi:hypothetical protein